MSSGEEHGHDEQQSGLSLPLLYSLILLVLVIAIGLAVLIVLPFYRRT